MVQKEKMENEGAVKRKETAIKALL